MSTKMEHALMSAKSNPGKLNAPHVLPTLLWKIAFHLSVCLTSALCMLTAVHDTLAHAIGPGAARVLTVTATLSAMVIAARLRHHWASGLIHVFWAATMTSFLAAGFALSFTQLIDSFVMHQPLISLASLPITFASAAFLVPISLVAHPFALVIWCVGSMSNAFCARQVLHYERQSAGA